MRRLITAIVVCVLAAAAVATATPSASAVPRWAPASKATIHPGVRTFTEGVQCRASFFFYDAHAVYLGQSSYCSGPLGTLVKIEGASRRGTVIYNSQLTMERVQESNSPTLFFNDFALVRIHNDDRGRVNPSVPFWGGPTASGGRSSFGAPVHTYGNSEVYTWEGDPWDGSGSPAGVNQLSPRIGIDTTTELFPTVPWGGLRLDGGDTAGWVHYIHTAAPGISGDTGSAVLDERGRALGILGYPVYDASDRVIDLPKAMAYMKANTSLDAIQLATGTERFLAQP